MEWKRSGILAVVLGLIVLLFVSVYRTPVVTSSVGTFGDVSLNIDYATTEAARERGLGGRAVVPENYAMLFVFPKDDYYGFWMKDMQVPLDMFWLDSKGRVVTIAENVATSSYPNVLYPTVPARYVLETAAGFASRHVIATGTPLNLQSLPTVSK